MEFMPNFKLYRPDNVDDAIKIKTEHADVRYVAGGTDMIVNVRRGIEQPQSLVDLTLISIRPVNGTQKSAYWLPSIWRQSLLIINLQPNLKTVLKLI